MGKRLVFALIANTMFDTHEPNGIGVVEMTHVFTQCRDWMKDWVKGVSTLHLRKIPLSNNIYQYIFVAIAVIEFQKGRPLREAAKERIKQMTFRVPKSVQRRFKSLAALAGKTITEILIEWVKFAAQNQPKTREEPLEVARQPARVPPGRSPRRKKPSFSKTRGRDFTCLFRCGNTASRNKQVSRIVQVGASSSDNRDPAAPLDDEKVAIIE